MVTNTIAPDIDSYWNSIAAAVPVYAPEEQLSALTLYRELAKGEPVTAEQFAAASGFRLPMQGPGLIVRRSGRSPISMIGDEF